MKSKAIPVKSKKKRWSPPEIEDVQEPFCGQYRQNMTCLSEYDPFVAAEWFTRRIAAGDRKILAMVQTSKPGGSANIAFAPLRQPSPTGLVTSPDAEHCFKTIVWFGSENLDDFTERK